MQQVVALHDYVISAPPVVAPPAPIKTKQQRRKPSRKLQAATDYLAQTPEALFQSGYTLEATVKPDGMTISRRTWDKARAALQEHTHT